MNPMAHLPTVADIWLSSYCHKTVSWPLIDLWPWWQAIGIIYSIWVVHTPSMSLIPHQVPCKSSSNWHLLQKLILFGSFLSVSDLEWPLKIWRFLWNMLPSMTCTVLQNIDHIKSSHWKLLQKLVLFDSFLSITDLEWPLMTWQFLWKMLPLMRCTQSYKHFVY